MVMEKIFDFSIKDLSSEFLTFSFDQIKRSNLLRIYLKEFVINEITKDIIVDQSDFDNAKEKFYVEKNLGNKEQLKKYLFFNGINEKDLEHQITLPLKMNILSTKVLPYKIENHFLKRKDQLDLYKYNVIRVENNNLAHEIYFQLEARESTFLTLSNKYSLDKEILPEAIVGPKNLLGMHPLIIEKLRNFEIGTLIKPFQIDKWWLVIKLLEKKQAKLDKNTRKLMALELCEMFVQDNVSELIKKKLKKFMN